MHQRLQWIPTFTLFPILYLIGWIISHFIYIFYKDISPSDLSLIGTIITFLSFVTLLPSWAKSRWKTKQPWRSVGLNFEKRYEIIKSQTVYTWGEKAIFLFDELVDGFRTARKYLYFRPTYLTPPLYPLLNLKMNEYLDNSDSEDSYDLDESDDSDNLDESDIFLICPSGLLLS